MPRYQLAQLNIVKMKYAIDDPRMSGFFDRVDDINRLVDVAPGFVWRLQIADGQLPVLEEASERLECLRELGPSARAFSFKQAFDPQ